MNELLRGIAFEDFIHAAGYAACRMTGDCGNSVTVQTKNTLAALKQFVDWLELNGHSISPEIAEEIRAAYSKLRAS